MAEIFKRDVDSLLTRLTKFLRPDKKEDISLVRQLAKSILETESGSGAVHYNLSIALRAAAYRAMSLGEVIAAHILPLTLAVAIEYLLFLFINLHSYDGLSLLKNFSQYLTIGITYAQPGSAVPHSASALPQSAVVGLVWLMAIVLSIVILGLLWSGYLANKRNEKAQAILQHIINSLLSLITGAVLAKGV
jgi:hypothetical protein